MMLATALETAPESELVYSVVEDPNAAIAELENESRLVRTYLKKDPYSSQRRVGAVKNVP